MSHTIEIATSGRAKCRGCGQRIDKEALRLGERLPNPFAEESLMTLWFHLPCGAHKRPEVLLEALPTATEAVPARETLEADAKLGLEHRRLPRIDGGGRAPTGRARCRSCREMISKGSWRIGLVFYEEGRFEPSGFIHAGCAESYFGTRDVLGRIAHFAPELDAEQLKEIERALQTESPPSLASD